MGINTNTTLGGTKLGGVVWWRAQTRSCERHPTPKSRPGSDKLCENMSAAGVSSGKGYVLLGGIIELKPGPE